MSGVEGEGERLEEFEGMDTEGKDGDVVGKGGWDCA